MFYNGYKSGGSERNTINQLRHSANRRNYNDDSYQNNNIIYRPKRRRPIPRLAQAARISLLSCLIIAVASSSNDIDVTATVVSSEPDSCKDAIATTTTPRIAVNLNFLNNPNPNSKQLPTISPRDSPQLGDGIRSSEASGIFFDSLDKDGDGAIEPEEVAIFLQEEIGGKQFDTQIEVDEEVGTIMERLDQNNNHGLEMSDLLDYWTQLESLLTTEEVAEWIVYSVQLPSSVGKIFLENGITGYDFLEIVDNGGKVLEDELGISKASFRNKIVRQMQARMLGIGSAPGTPQQFTHKLESCKAVTLSWNKSTARVFPVHSYRIQRRAINLFGSALSSSVDELSGTTNSNTFDSFKSDWKTAYVGSDTEFADSGLEMGHNYMYRIQAWNSAGRSGWQLIDLTNDLKKKKCSTKPSPKLVTSDNRGTPVHEAETQEGEWLAIPKNIAWAIVATVQFLYQSVRFFFALIALLAGMMRFRRATATSSASATATLPFPWFWRGINRLSVKYFGQECIPKTMLGDREALLRQEQLHDDQIMATGLRGYERLKKTTREKSSGSASKDKSERPKNKNVNGGIGDRRSALRKVKSHSTGDLTSSTVTFGLPSEVVIPNESNTPNKFAWMRPANKKSPTVSFISETSEESSRSSTTDGRKKGTNIVPKSSHPRRSSYVDDDSRCSECEKKFRIGKRYKHHCARCMASFCHKHGRTTHSNFTSCKVPGDCICNSCLLTMSNGPSERSRSSQ